MHRLRIIEGYATARNDRLYKDSLPAQGAITEEAEEARFVRVEGGNLLVFAIDSN